MKVVVKGTIPEERIWEGTCGRCNSVMEEEGGKLKIMVETNKPLSYATTQCPVCFFTFIMHQTDRSIKKVSKRQSTQADSIMVNDR